MVRGKAERIASSVPASHEARESDSAGTRRKRHTSGHRKINNEAGGVINSACSKKGEKEA